VAARVVAAAREARLKGKAAATREAASRAAAARAGTWSLVSLLQVQLLNMPLLNATKHATAAVLFVQLSLLFFSCS
jgi:hypothetical protein